MPRDGELLKPETVRQLEAAKALIADPANWCQGMLGWTQDGKPLETNRPDFSEVAARVCSVGSVCVVVGWDKDVLSNRILELLDQAAEQLDCVPPPDFSEARASVKLNDATDHPTVMRMFDRAIELAWEAHRATAQA